MRVDNKIKYYRKRQGVTQKELANFLHVSINTILSYERGEYMPNLENAIKLAFFFGVNFEYLFELGF